MQCRRFLLSIFFWLPLASYGQILVKGVLLELGDNSPVAYANIGILNSSIGTISNSDGSFELSVSQQHLGDSLLIAALGFERKSFLISSLKNPCTIYLRENVTMLHNIVVKSRKIRPAISGILGNKYYNASSIHTDSITAGAAMALLIENKPPNYNPEIRLPYYATHTRLRIQHNSFDKFRVRVRFLAVDSLTGLPSKDLINESIIATSAMTRGWLDIDLTKYNVIIQKPAFFLVFEWLIGDEDRELLREQYAEFKRQFPKRVSTDTVIVDGEKVTINNWHGLRAGTAFGSSSVRAYQDQYKTFFRNNSYGRWRRSSFILAATITISNYNPTLR